MSCLFALLLVVGLLAALTWLVRSLQRTRGLAERVARLEEEVAVLNRRVHGTAPAAKEDHSSGQPSSTAESSAEAVGTSDDASPSPSRVSQPPSRTDSEAAERTISRSDVVPTPSAQSADEVGEGVPVPEPPPPSRPGSRTASEPERPSRPAIDWEQWVGVRGAALLGAIAFALAGIYLVRWGMERGLISPVVRVTLGLLGGIAAIGAGEVLRARRYALLANSLAGAGLVCLFAALWAARNLYGLIGDGVAALLFVLCTVAGGALSVRHRSQVIAILGLLGGFATPLLTGSQSDQPVQLFVYLILLNAAVAWVAQRNGWRRLPLLAVAATVFYQGLWVFGAMAGRVELATGLLIATSLALLALGAWMRGRVDDSADPSTSPSTVQRLSESLALAAPLLFGIYFAGTSDLGRASLPLFVLLLVLSVTATVLARVHRMTLFSYGGVAATLGSAAAWSWRRLEPGQSFTLAESLLTSAAALALVLAQLALHELWRRRTTGGAGDAAERLTTKSTAALGLGLLTLAAMATWMTRGPSFVALFVVGSAIVAALWRLTTGRAARLGASLGALWPQWLGSSAFALVIAGRLLNGESRQAPAVLSGEMVGVGCLIYVLVLLASSMRRDARAEVGLGARRAAVLAMALPCGLLILALTGTSDTSPLVAICLVSALTLVALLAATRWRWGSMAAPHLLLCAFSHTMLHERTELPLLVLSISFATSAMCAMWPSWLAPRALDGSRVLHRMAAIVPWLFLPALIDLWQGEEHLNWPAIGLLPLALAAVQLFVVRRLVELRATGDAGSAEERTARVAWAAASALSLVAVAIPLQLDREWITVGWALQTLAVIAIWRRIDHPGLKLFALILATAVTLRLVFNDAVLDYHPAQFPLGLPLLNWLVYGYLVPAAALLWARRLLTPLEVTRLRPRERPLYTWRGKQLPVVSLVLGAQAALIVFAWINLTIFDAFAAGRDLDLTLERLPLRDLVLSLAWITYAVALLLLGLWRGARGVRSLSLLVMLAALAKVFFYDLGELTGILRVASLLGLAMALIGISLLYQRFVFQREGERPLGDASRPNGQPEDAE